MASRRASERSGTRPPKSAKKALTRATPSVLQKDIKNAMTIIILCAGEETTTPTPKSAIDHLRSAMRRRYMTAPSRATTQMTTCALITNMMQGREFAMGLTIR